VALVLLKPGPMVIYHKQCPIEWSYVRLLDTRRYDGLGWMKMAWEHDIHNIVEHDTEEFDIIVSNKSLYHVNSMTNLVISNKLALTTFMAFGMIAIAAMTATTISTQEAYADAFCGTNYQGSFHISPGYPPWTPLSLPDNTKTISDH
jgi:hypothetical protein